MILFFENLVLFEVRFFKESKFEMDNIFAICCNELALLGIDARNSIGVPSSFSFHLPVSPYVNLDIPPQKREHNDIVVLVFRKENFIDLY
jgi:hypothetical protein